MIHQALTYDSDDEFVERLAPFLLEGLRGGDHAVAVTVPHRLRLLREALGAAGDAAEFVDSRTWYDAPGRTLGAYHRKIHAHRGPGRLRVVGEPVWTGRNDTETTEWTRYEAVVNVVFAATSAWIVCPYHAGEVPPEVVADAARTHPELITGRGARSSDGYADPAGLYAELDTAPLPPAPLGAERFDFGPGALGAVRRFVERSAQRGGLLNGRLGTFVTAVNEAATNVLNHGAGRGSIVLWTDSRGLVCDVVDAGGGVHDCFPGHLPPRARDRRGAGLWAARQLCDLVEIRSGAGGTTVRLRLAAPLARPDHRPPGG